MNTERWQKVKTLLDAALDQPSGARVAFLEKTCTDNTLRAEVRSLLDARDGGNDTFFERGAFNHELFSSEAPSDETDETNDDASLLQQGTRIGAYRLTGVLGRGGMGTVYRAVRADGAFDQQVAVKLLRPEMASDEGLRRFRDERQILASLHHPGIAHILDGGVLCEDGPCAERPYLVMELVDGTPIDQYCDEQRLPVEKRVALLRQVAQAVQHAHRKLVVHRDLKPSNVLITPEGRVKLVDFGIAKLLEQGPAPSEDPLAEAEQRWITPEYAAPEQIARAPITTATDVYQLGLLAHQLLAGHRPFAAPGRLPHEVARRVLREEVPAPSSMLRHRPEAAPSFQTLSDRRSTKPRQLQHALRGDLDHIVMKAMRKEPEHRYASAEAFDEDLRRYQNDLPVEARPATWRYRTSRFLQRHRLGIAATVLLVLMGAGYAASMVSQVRETARQHDKAEALATFMTDLFEMSDPSEAASEAITARDLLDRGARRAQSGLHRQPTTQAAFLNVTGDVYRRLGLYDEAQPLLKQALSVRQRIHGTRHPDVAESLHALGRLRYEQGRYNAAALLYRQALKMRGELLGRRHPDAATTLRALGWVHQQTDRHAAADSLFRRALSIRRSALGPDHPDVAESMSDRAASLRIRGRYQEAERRYRQALRRYRQAFGQTHLSVAEGLHNMAVVMQNQGRYGEAASYAQKALQRYRALFGEQHPDVATSLSNLAYVQQKVGRYDNAERNYRRALAMRERLLGDDHPHVANSLNNLAALLQDRGRYQKAEPLAERALQIYRNAYGDEHGTVAQALTTLAWLRRNRGDLEGAEPLFREAVKVRQTLHGGTHPRVAKAQSYLAGLLQARGTLEEAEALFHRALRTLDASVSRQHPYRAIVLTGLGDVLTQQGRNEAAVPLLHEALALRKGALPSGHWRTAKTQTALGRCLAAQKKYPEARSLLAEAHATLTQARGPDDPLTRRAKQGLDALPADPQQ